MLSWQRGCVAGAKPWASSLSLHKLNISPHPSSWKAEAGGSQVSGQAQSSYEFHVNWAVQGDCPQKQEAGWKMAQWLRRLSALGQDLCLVPSTHVRHLITACNSSFRASDTTMGPPLAQHIQITGTQTCISMKIFFFEKQKTKSAAAAAAA